MKRFVMMTLCILMLIPGVTGCGSSGSSGSNESIELHNSPQIYALVGEDALMIMPTVTLYDNGDARLSQPGISSYFLAGTGHFQVSGNELTVTYDENISATFTISDGGDTLTLKSSNLGYTKVGAVYQYRAKADDQARKWLDYYFDDNLPWDESIDLTLPEFPGVTLTWTAEKVTANGIDLIWGMPVWNVYLADLNHDGKPELCATVSLGSGIIDTRVVVYDYANRQEYQLADRMKYDYHLTLQDGKLMVTQTEYSKGEALAIAELLLVDGEIVRFD